jgi:lipopolysaccharide/colanic/teichoic acid biosynthesis glycosyltransferase
MSRQVDEKDDAPAHAAGPRGLYFRVGKRTLDTLLAGAAMLVLSPVIAIVALIVWIRDGPPAFYVQVRPGRRERPFKLIKFRTMTIAQPVPADRAERQHVTKVGAFLRRWSLDELPQLVNVLRGDMSLVGPRPLLMRYLPHFTPPERRRFTVRPGLTGWAQVQGRNAIDWDTRLALDGWYVDRCSFVLDVRIMIMTIGKVLSGHGANVDLATALPDLDHARTDAAGRSSDPQHSSRSPE